MLSKPETIVSWVLQLVIAGILFQTLFFKFTGAEESVYIFSTLGIEPWGRIASGVAELVAVGLILYRRPCLRRRAVARRHQRRPREPHQARPRHQGRGGLLFLLAVIVFFSSLAVVYLRRMELPVVGERLFRTVAYHERDSSSAHETAAVPAGQMACLLDQLAAVVAQLDDSHYRVARAREVSGSVGGHVRHCLDHVAALVSGLENGHVDYDVRVRGTAIESRREAALAEIARLAARLESVARCSPDTPVWVMSAAPTSRRLRWRASWRLSSTPSITSPSSRCCCTMWESGYRRALATRQARRARNWQPERSAPAGRFGHRCDSYDILVACARSR